jgi:hypothetical protein
MGVGGGRVCLSWGGRTSAPRGTSEVRSALLSANVVMVPGGRVATCSCGKSCVAAAAGQYAISHFFWRCNAQKESWMCSRLSLNLYP